MPAKLRHAFQPREFSYPANLITLARVLLLPAAIYYMRREDGRWRAPGIFGGAMATDMLDGPVARISHEGLATGPAARPDPADKLMIDTAAITLSANARVPMVGHRPAVSARFRDPLGQSIRVPPPRADQRGRPSWQSHHRSAGRRDDLYLADGPRSGKPALYIALLPFGASLVVYARKFVQVIRHQSDAE